MHPNSITPAQALERLMDYCSRYETCTHKALQKLREWQIEPQEGQRIVQRLTEQRFIDDARYAQGFVRSRQALKWGAQKIAAHLHQQHISDAIIAQAMQSIDPDTEQAALEHLLRKKWHQIKARSDAERQAKLIRFAVGRGYRYPSIAQVIRKIAAGEEDT